MATHTPRDGLLGASDKAKPHSFSGRVCFQSPQDALLALTSVAVDAELRLDAVSRDVALDGSNVVFSFRATEARLLRTAAGTFLELLSLAAATLERFRV